jgi:hypothetical protein
MSALVHPPHVAQSLAFKLFAFANFYLEQVLLNVILETGRVYKVKYLRFYYVNIRRYICKPLALTLYC